MQKLDLLRLDELWVVDDEREDYTTLQLIEGDLLLSWPLQARQELNRCQRACSRLLKSARCRNPDFFLGQVGSIARDGSRRTCSPLRKMDDIRRIMKTES